MNTEEQNEDESLLFLHGSPFSIIHETTSQRGLDISDRVQDMSGYQNFLGQARAPPEAELRLC